MQKLSSNGLGLHATHKIENQPSILENYNIYDSDKVLADCIQKSNAEWASDQLQKLGSVLGSSEFIEHGNLANNNKPIFHSHDRHGHRIDQVEYHPSYHQLFKLTVANGIHSDPWANPKSGAHAARAAKLFMTYQVDQGHICPTTMTYGCVPAISRQKEVADTWLPKIFSNEYDGSFRPIAEKSGATVGMAMTEKQGGSDVRSNTSTASPISTSGAGKDYLINGHKWFCSAPMSDAFLMLANTDGGPSCFLVPRWLPSGEKNNIFIQRLKNKLGDHSNASSEIELRDTFGTLIGDEGRGVSIIIEMASLTRVDCCLAAASLMRQGAVQALHYTSQRSAFGALLTEQPIMQKVLADLILESEASTRLAIRLASSYDALDDPFETSFRRIATAASKYWLTKRSIQHTAEAMETLGGIGYVEESILARLYRQAPVNSIWEGSGNVMCLDVLRAMQKEPDSIEALVSELSKSSGMNKHYDKAFEELKKGLLKPALLLSNARVFVEETALLLQSHMMLGQSEDKSGAELFCQTRLTGSGPSTFGRLPDCSHLEGLIQRARVQP